MTKEEKLERAYKDLNSFVIDTAKDIYEEQNLSWLKVFNKAKSFCETIEEDEFNFAMDKDVGRMMRTSGYIVIDRPKSDFPELDPLTDLSGYVSASLVDGEKIIRCKINPVTHELKVQNYVPGSCENEVRVEANYASFSYKVIAKKDYETHVALHRGDKLFYIGGKAWKN